MQSPSRIHIVVTILAVFIIGWFVIGRDKTDTQNIAPVSPVVSTEALWPSREVKKETISDTNQYYTIDASYPVTRDVRISDQFKAFVEEQIAQFKDDTSWVMDPNIDSAAASSLSLDINYREEVSTHVNTYVFGIVTYTGGAHGLQVTRTFAFDANGKALTFSDLLSTGTKGLETISAFVQKELLEKGRFGDPTWVAEGAGPTLENYKSFIVSDTGVTVIFDPYQVAPYAAGTQNVFVPLSVFKGSAHPDLFTL